MCLDVDGSPVTCSIRRIAKDARTGLQSTQSALTWLDKNNWIAISKNEGYSHSYVAFSQQVKPNE
jgi:hypothetical protein